MTKQPASNSRKRARGGYRRKPKRPDWSIDGEYLVWNRGNETRIPIVETSYQPHQYSSENYVRLSRKVIENLVTKIKNTVGKQFPKKMHHFVLRTAEEWKISDYFEIGAQVVASNQFSDAEKMSFLERISDLQGYKYGQNVVSLISRLRWKNKNFLKRCNAYVKLTEGRDGDNEAIEIDNRIVQSLPNIVIVYRGFNVPHQRRIRDMKNWLKQEYGTGPYYSLSSMTALSFACQQKLLLAGTTIDFGTLKKSEMEIFEGKIVVAKFSVPRNKIIIYRHASKFLESECICDPKDVSLVRYDFCGFDKFIECDKWFYGWNKRINERSINERYKVAKEIALTPID